IDDAPRDDLAPQPWLDMIGDAPRPTPRPKRRLSRPRPPIYVAQIGGEEVVLVPIGELALALGRRPGTIRAWERRRILPPAPFSSPSGDYRGRRRMYSPQHIEGTRRIAAETGVLHGKPVDISRTNFPARMRGLY